MRKSVFLALLIFIYYIAGMYENPALMVLFLTQLFLIPVMFILSRYLKKHLSVSVEEKTVFAEKDRPFTWTLKAENRGRLPVTRFALRFQIFRKRRVEEKTDVFVFPRRDEMQIRKESVYAAEPPDLQGAMRLTLDLVWFKGEDLIFRFSEENLGQELSRQNFEL